MEELIEVIKHYDLSSKSRKREMVYRRMYLFKYLREMKGMSFERIGLLFNRDHATVIHGSKQVNALLKYEDFQEHVAPLVKSFPIASEHDAICKIMIKNKTVVCRFTGDQYMNIQQLRISEGMRSNEEAIKLMVDSYISKQ